MPTHRRYPIGPLAKRTIKSALASAGIGVTRYETLEKLRSAQNAQRDIEFLRTMFNPDTAAHAAPHLYHALECLPNSRSQFRQDLFVLSQLDFKTNGYFVEFGATNGIELSNTYLLEKEFQWTGILAEPAQSWQKALKRNRTAHIETSCVWKDSNSTLTFNEVENAGLSTISDYSDIDLHQDARKQGRQYSVNTISLLDLLTKYKAPEVIDYLSIDTEGSEFAILDSFDFSKYRFRIITCEHNYTPMRDAIFELLTNNGYSRVFPDVSFNDDWYVSRLP
ncbi:FkbM family methyltransferase [Mycolicibacterium helvum]|uniref:Methyltransferase FkbM domain-containing protein n=1 Tax=Mycolicibacterium helvum TaxID=1534349 RepID=A0A7I7T247_9MYCO|nr:FkbM family methyltransferase [Mycolicibacterium helvum]BBY63013.1 hypothetical protein MHEL_12560 [Mycolicibacterium helvum]